MQKSNKVEIRVTDLEKKDWQEAAGGARLVSSWLRSLANAECARLRGEKKTPLSTTAAILPDRGPLLTGQPTPRDDEQCPRWMHHRPGVYCGSCKKVIK